MDPIDGTVNYLYDIPAWSVSIAVVEGDPDPGSWSLQAGAVAAPSLGETYSASLGGGATLNGKQIRTTEASSLALSLVATGFTYSAVNRTRQAAVLTGLVGEVRDIRRSGSAAVDLCYVASGRINAYYESFVNPWDHAAGSIIAREAGAIVGGFDRRLEEVLKGLYVGDGDLPTRPADPAIKH